ncbi:MAG: serine hydrolase domain-containing protein [Verrucomicrobiota bacterium]
MRFPFSCLSLLLTVAGFAATPPHAKPEEVLAPFVQREELAGAVALVADKEKVLRVTSVGFAEIEAKKAMQPAAVFWIASQSKGMTAAAVMMLVDEGKLSLDDPVEKYLPEFKDQQVAAGKGAPVSRIRSITIRDLLSHVSGLPFKSEEEKPTLDGLPLATAVKTYAKAPLVTQPGARYQYSNAGINTAARVLEVVSGMAYEEFMQKRLFDPLGMKDTTFWPDAGQVARLAKTYKPDAAKKKLVPGGLSQLQAELGDRTRRFPMPAGGLFSTAQDVSLFCRMLLNGGELEGRRYLSLASVQVLSARQTPADMKESYGLGFAVGPDFFGHGGAQATGMEIRTKDGLVLVWMVQHQGFPGKGGQAQGEFKKAAVKEFGGK